MKVTWDPAKAEENLRKHGVAFEDASGVFDDPLVASMHDLDHSEGELHQLSIGESNTRRIVVVWYVLRNEVPHLIGARKASSAEKKRFMRGDEIRDEPALDEMKDEYDFTDAVQGPKSWLNLRRRIWLDADVAKAFRSEEIVNDTLRALMRERGASQITAAKKR